ncbi:unnamed protein product [Fraxinus pennsylvanica]|uniref:EF-hand domain-containing protein n=1 Tax=Fraxinus pennsylvanica TaxID=56036 RepID=A0AAD2E1D7_9LAMI|nr:unnamed protein product [Fraxinus pennsylvanica]
MLLMQELVVRDALEVPYYLPVDLPTNPGINGTALSPSADLEVPRANSNLLLRLVTIWIEEFLAMTASGQNGILLRSLLEAQNVEDGVPPLVFALAAGSRESVWALISESSHHPANPSSLREIDEMIEIAKSHYERASEEEKCELRKLFRALDADRDGKVSFQDFYEFCTHHTSTLTMYLSLRS